MTFAGSQIIVSQLLLITEWTLRRGAAVIVNNYFHCPWIVMGDFVCGMHYDLLCRAHTEVGREIAVEQL
jgi:hypothetical protein